MNRFKGLVRQLLTAVAAATMSGMVLAADGAPGHETEMRIRSALAQVLPNTAPDSIAATPVPGLYEVMFGPRLVYISEDGRYLLQGSLIDLETRQDLTEPRLAAAKLKAIEAVGEANMLVYAPEKPKHVITVFTDIDCGFCRKLHAELDQYLAQGIEIRYLLYPRAGENSESYQKAVSVWCADDRRSALTAAKQGQEVPPRTCANPVLEHMALGRLIGLQGTPALVLDDGEVVPGYVPADKLRQMLDQRTTAAR